MQTGKLLQTWYQVAPPVSAKSDGFSFKILRERNQLGRLEKLKFCAKLPRKSLPRACNKMATRQVSLKSGPASQRSSTGLLDLAAIESQDSAAKGGSM